MRLSRVVRFVGGCGFPHADQGGTEGTPIYKVGDLSMGATSGIARPPENWIDDETVSRLGAFVAPAGSVLLPKIGAAIQGRHRRVLIGWRSAFDNNVLALVPTAVDGRFLRYWLDVLDLRPLTQPGAVGSLDISALRALRTPVIGRSTQSRVADFLDRECERIGWLSNDLAALRMAVSQEHQAVVHEELAATSAHEVPLSLATDPSRPIMYGIVLPGEAVSEGVLLVKGGNVERDELAPSDLFRVAPEIERPFARARLRTDDILVTIRGSYGAIAQVPETITGANITQDTARVAPGANVSARYLLHVLRTSRIQDQINARATGAGVRGLNIRDLKRVMLPLPPLDDQLRLARRWDSRRARVNRLSAEARETMAALIEYRDALITEAVTGKLDVTRLSERQMNESAQAAMEGERPEVLSA